MCSNDGVRRISAINELCFLLQLRWHSGIIFSNDGPCRASCSLNSTMVYLMVFFALMWLVSIHALNQMSSLVEEKSYNPTRAPEGGSAELLYGEPMMSFVLSAVKVINVFDTSDLHTGLWICSVFLWLTEIWRLESVQIVYSHPPSKLIISDNQKDVPCLQYLQKLHTPHARID